MLSRTGRPLARKLFGPIAKVAVKAGISADAITIAGTAASCALALTLVPAGWLAPAALLIAVVVIFDNLDGQVARLTGTASKWGAFLDSTLDRVADGAIFSGVLAWAYLHGEGVLRPWLMGFALASLVFGSVVPYARARAEGLGMEAAVGIAERADRLAVILVAMLLTGVGLGQWVMLVALAFLSVAAAITVLQRMLVVYHQAVPRGLFETPRAVREAAAGLAQGDGGEAAEAGEGISVSEPAKEDAGPAA